MSAGQTVSVLELQPVLDLVSREIAALQIQMREINARLDVTAAQLERHRQELVRLSRAIEAMRPKVSAAPKI